MTFEEKVGTLLAAGESVAFWHSKQGGDLPGTIVAGALCRMGGPEGAGSTAAEALDEYLAALREAHLKTAEAAEQRAVREHEMAARCRAVAALAVPVEPKP